MKLRRLPKIGVILLLGSWMLQAYAGQVREYWIAAEKVMWDYAPSGQNLINPDAGLGVWGERTVYEKYRYIQYIDGSYTTPVPQPEWMGVLGPQLRAEVGDTIMVHFLNRTDRPLSMHPHGLRYDEDNDGADRRGAGGIVPPGGSFTYVWEVDQAAGPGSDDPSSIVWLYHSHVVPEKEINLGLVGTIVVTAKGMARSKNDPRPKDVDEEFTTLFMVFDEEDGEEGGLMHSMNGYIFGNLQGYRVSKGARVRWHVISMGNEVDLHTAHWHRATVLDGPALPKNFNPHWHGATVLEGPALPKNFNRGKRLDTVPLLPATTKSLTLEALRPGTWLFHCHVHDHMKAGMITRWQVVE